MKRSAHHRLSRRRWLIALPLVLGLIVLLDQRGLLLARGSDDLRLYHGVRVEVLRIIDGDTIDVAMHDPMHDKPATRVRLWGIDAPEMARGNLPAQPFAAEAADFARQRAAKQHVTLWLEPHRVRDKFGRILAHVEFADGSRLNELMLEQGLARADERWPHSMLTRYAQVELNARRRGQGMWANGTPKLENAETSKQ